MPRKPNEPLPTDANELDPLTKAAILLMTLETGTAAILLKNLSTESVEEVTRELAALGNVDTALRFAVVEEFYNLSIASEYMARGGLEYAKVLLKESLDGSIADKVLAQ